MITYQKNIDSVRDDPENTVFPPNARKQSITHQDHIDASKNDLDTVRGILLGKEYDELIALKKKTEDPIKHSESIAEIISEALAIRSSQDNSIAKILVPTIEKSLTTSIINDPEPIAEALYPVMGPAIRKSISEALLQMLGTFNQLLEQGFSLKALKWRFDAWRTGRSYSEVILLKTLVYQVEEVFLINREDGILLQHTSLESIVVQDSDMVSGMLTAIQDFIKDSFSIERGEKSELNILRLGDLTVLIEHGPKAVLAAVVRGKPPEDIQLLLKSTLETIHQQHAKDLRDYTGDNKPFNRSQRLLQACLKVQKQEQKKNRLRLYILLLLLVASASYWGYTKHLSDQEQQRLKLESEVTEQRNNLRWQRALDTLKSEPGLVVINAQNDKNKIEILRDPLARLPSQILSDQVGNQTIIFKTKPYLSIDDEIILLRTKKFLNVPAEVNIDIKNTILYVSGSPSLTWITKLQNSWKQIAGVSELNIKSITRYDKNRPIILSLKSKAEGYKVLFQKNKSKIDQSNDMQIEHVSHLIKKLVQLAPLSEESVTVSLIGRTDSSGTDAINRELALQRMVNVKGKLISLGIPESAFINSPSEIIFDESERSVRYKIKLISSQLGSK